jgi:hypothetical protein
VALVRERTIPTYRSLLVKLVITFADIIIIIIIIIIIMVRVSGYRSKGVGFDSRRFQIFWEAVGLERGPLSLVRTRKYNWGATWKK